MKLFEVVDMNDETKETVFIVSIFKILGLLITCGLLLSFMISLLENDGLNWYFQMSYLTVFSMLIGIYIGMCYQCGKQKVNDVE